MMCHQPVDSLPMSNSIFSGSWIGIGLGLVIVVGIVIGVTRAQGISDDVARAVERVTPTSMPTFTPNPTPTGTSPPTVTLTPLPTPTPRIHLVEGGETLEYIALRYGVRVDQLIDLNEVEDVRALSVGQPLIIPGEQELEQNPDLVPLLRVYVIEEGDTLSSISYEIGTPMEAIVAANPNLNLDLIFPGQEIIVPLSTPTPTATVTPLPTLLLNWTSTRHLAEDEFYVVHLEWPDGATTEHWAQNTSWRIFQQQRPANGVISWTVTIVRQTGTSSDGTPVGRRLSRPASPQWFEWR
jgi:LysM repeat protein